jgi:hypothetical protein
MSSVVPSVALGLLLAGALPAAEPDQVARDEQTLREAKVGTDGPALLEFFRKRTAKDVDPTKIKALVRQLGDDSFEKREQASAQLIAVGASAVPHLKEALKDPDIEIVRRAEECLRRIGEGSTGAVVDAAARLLAARKPDGAAEALLAYLPYAEDDIAADEVREALAALAVRDGKVDPAVVNAAADKLPARRAAAATALARSGIAQHRQTADKLLQDSDQTVRLHAALGLAAAGEKKAVPVLIDLLADLPPAQLGLPLELLNRLAKDQAPALAPGKDPAARKKYRDAWAAWWAKNGGATDLGKPAPAPKPLGYTMVVLLDQGRILELNEKNEERWRIDGLQFPLDAQYLPNDRVLVAEQQANRVTERNLKGEIVWKKEVAEPLVAQRLLNGNTLIANRTEVIEVDRDGKELLRWNPSPNEQIMRAQRRGNGEILLVIQSLETNTSRFVRLDPSASAELQTFPVEVRTSGGRFEMLPDNRVLIPQLGNNRVVEYDRRGKVAWQLPVEQPIVALRLPNGNTLATSMTQNRAVELTREGKQVWEYKSDSRVTRAFRR